MTVGPAELWPWLALAGLGLFHGVNPAMGWLFAVALGLHRGSQRTVLLSLLPIALGHALAVAAVMAGVLVLGLAIDHVTLTRLAGLMLIGWAAWHGLRGHRQRVRVGMQTGLAGLLLWSFLMASAHGAGLMVIPVLLPLCDTAGALPLLADGAGQSAGTGPALPYALAALGVHTAAMLATIAAVSIAVYRWAGVDFLRRGWVNLDLVWVAALLACGVLLIVI